MSFADWDAKSRKRAMRDELNQVKQDIQGMYEETNRLSARINQLYLIFNEMDRRNPGRQSLHQEIEGVKLERKAVFERINEEKERRDLLAANLREYPKPYGF